MLGGGAEPPLWFLDGGNMMHVDIDYGVDHLGLDLRAENLVGVRRQAPAAPLADLSAAVRAALEEPFGFPPLRRALTPDDHVTVVVDEELAHIPELLVPILEHLVEARIQPDA